jgi:glycosyltransferase involved in cell wall biosynthesis
VFSFHTTTVPRWEGRFTRLLNYANVVTFVSGAQLAEIRKRLRIAGDLRILSPATELLRPDPNAQREFSRRHSLAGRFPVLAFAGPLEYPMKVNGVIDLIASLRQVLKKHPTTKLFVLGDGGLRNRVVAAAEEFGDTVDIPGFVDDPRLALSMADIYCHISYQEGLPLSLLEAMSLGKCVLAYPAGGIPEVIDGTNGFLVGSGPDAIAAAILRLAGDPVARASAGEAARETVASSYTWETRLPQIDSIYGLA